MDDLRLILLIAGVGVIGLIYFFETRRRAGAKRTKGNQSGSAPSEQGVNDDPLERARDEHAARNARALIGLDEFDIDTDEDVVVMSPNDEFDSDNAPSPGRPAVIRRRTAGDSPSASAAPQRGPEHADADDVLPTAAQTPNLAATPSSEELEAPPPENPPPALHDDPDSDLTPVQPGMPVTVRARRNEPEQLDLSGLSMSAQRGGDPAEVVESLDVQSDPAQVPAAKQSESSPSDPAPKPSPSPDPNPGASSESDPAPEPFMIVLTVMARDQQHLAGRELVSALERESLKAGDDDLYHRSASGTEGGEFSVLNVVKPGVFKPDQIDTLTTPGVALVMDAGPMAQPRAAFDAMLESAQRIADSLDARVCDHGRNPLTTQAVNHLHESIAEHSRRKLLRG